MATNIPTWIDTCYVKSILKRQEYDESVKITNITVKSATGKGDNYLSDMFRVGIEFTCRVQNGDETQKKISVILKVAFTDENVIATADFFRTEMGMMMNTLPRMNQMLTELGMPSLSAQSLLVQKENPMHLVLEDLAARGFKMGSRQTGFDLDHCLLVFRNLGRFHASSVALKEKDPQALANYTKGAYHIDQPPLFSRMISQGMRALAKETRKWNEISPQITEKLFKLSEIAFKKACEAVSYRKDDFNVLAHGDCWVNNMMFRYDEFGKPIEQVFVDFQISFYGTPAEDILKFLATSPIEDVRINHRELLLRIYHESLTSTMSKLKCTTNIPSFDELQKILKERAFLEAITYFVALPVMLVDASEVTSLDEMTASTEKGNDVSVYRNTTFKKYMIRVLPLYDSMGLLDD